MSFTKQFLANASALLNQLDASTIDVIAAGIASTRDARGRLFVLGVGGSAANASHAVADFRKLCGVEAYAPTDNIAELTARTNDEGWDTSIAGWLQGSNISSTDAVLVFSVGGGDRERAVSTNLVAAVDLAISHEVKVFGVLGRDGGHVARVATASVIIPPTFPALVTAMTEGITAIVWHLLVSHPLLARHTPKWEATGLTSPP